MHIQGLHQRGGPWYVIEHVVRDRDTGSIVSLARAEWADWCHSGDLLFAKEGKLFRLGFSANGILAEPNTANLLIDLSNRIFKEVAPSTEAMQWDDQSLEG